MLSRYARHVGSKMTKLSSRSSPGIYTSINEIKERKQYLIELGKKSNIDKFLAQYQNYIDPVKIKRDMHTRCVINGGIVGSCMAGAVAMMNGNPETFVIIGLITIPICTMVGHLATDGTLAQHVQEYYDTSKSDFKTFNQICRETNRANHEIKVLNDVEKTGEYDGIEIYRYYA